MIRKCLHLQSLRAMKQWSGESRTPNTFTVEGSGYAINDSSGVTKV
jgi:hypothetical protein